MRVKDLILCGLFTALICVGAFIKIPIPAMPITLQVQFVVLAGMLLGGTLGGTSALVYMVLGLVGLPIFTQGGGFGYVFQPTFGYIVGFILGAYVTGKIASRESRPSYRRLFIAAVAGLAVIYLIGMVYFYLCNNYMLNIPFSVGTTLVYCVAMVIPGDLITCTLAVLLARRLIPIINKNQ